MLKCCKKNKIIQPELTMYKEITIKKNPSYGCQICNYVVISGKNKCKHRFCDYCLENIIKSFNPHCNVCKYFI